MYPKDLHEYSWAFFIADVFKQNLKEILFYNNTNNLYQQFEAFVSSGICFSTVLSYTLVKTWSLYESRSRVPGRNKTTQGFYNKAVRCDIE